MKINKKIVKEIHDKIVEITNNIYNSRDKKEQSKLEKQLDLWKNLNELKLIEKMSIESVDSNSDLIKFYPDIFNIHSFSKDIFSKKEFNDFKYPKKLPSIKDICYISQNKLRQLHNSQNFVKNYLSPYTPYNGILLWWGVGRGKTCAAISSRTI